MSDNQIDERLRVGASVVVDGYPPGIVNPARVVPPVPPIQPIPPIGIPQCNPCCNIPFFPPVPLPPPFLPPGIIIDDRVIPPRPPVPPVNRVVALTASVAPQTIAATSTAVVLLSSAISSVGGASISGSSIILPVAGTYRLSITITAGRSVGSTGGIVTFILNGGITGSGMLATADLATSATQVFSGSTILQTNTSNTPISILVNNAGGAMQILGGTISVQLISSATPYF